MKFFNTAGPINPADHYCVPLSHRLNEEELYRLIEEKKYFVLHAPRQTGKTSVILNFVTQLNAQHKYTALYVNVEPAQALRGNIEQALPVILQELKNQAKLTLSPQDPFFDIFGQLKKDQTPSGSLLTTFLGDWCAQSSKPIVLFIDEIDSLGGDTLISVLRQIRAGYANRPHAFPQSLCLIGVRDVRDYRIWSETGQQIISGGSAFNIKARSLTLANFTEQQVCELYLQHTAETGQQFDSDAIEYAFEMTQGQPWLVNSLAYIACFEMVTNRSLPITLAVIQQAKETLILRKETHLDVLSDRLQEPRVRRIIDAIINSETRVPTWTDDDLEYTINLGLIKPNKHEVAIANPIYQEIFPRVLTARYEQAIAGRSKHYIRTDGSLDIHKLLSNFADFYRENSAIWLEQFEYKESGPHLILLAFLQRIVNGGGTIHREYALGRGRVDILVTWQNQRIVIELKLFKDKNTLPKGLEQTAKYMDTSHATEGHLVIFDTSSAKSWDEKVYSMQERIGNKTITVWGM